MSRAAFIAHADVAGPEGYCIEPDRCEVNR